jgi:hypothetical protein
MGHATTFTRHHCSGTNRKIRDILTGEVFSARNCRKAWTPSVPQGRYCSKHEEYCRGHPD